jgi:hypothetical protein
MRKYFLRIYGLSLALLLACSTSALSAPLQRGDYDNDGKQDLAVALVSRQGTAGSTAYLVRGSNLGLLSWSFGRPTDAYAPGRFFPNWGTVPASVLVTSALEPLLWTVRAPDGSDVLVRFGSPGDHIVNLIDWDGDLLDDFQVVRDGAVSEFGDGVSYKHWLIALSAYGGTIVDIIFGLKGDRSYTFYDNDLPQFGALRLATVGACAGQFEWFNMNFSLDASARTIKSRCWGLPGDIPLVPRDLNGNKLADYIVVRPEGGIQTAYVLYDDSSTATFSLGLATAIPLIGDFDATGGQLAWIQRDQGLVGRRLQGQNIDIFPFGIAANTIIRPDGSVVEPNSNDRFTDSTNGSGGGGGGGGSIAECQNPRGSGFLYKPASQDSNDSREGFPLVLMSRFNSGESCGEVLASNGQVISYFGRFTSNRYYEGAGCGRAERNSASSLAQLAQAAAGSPSGYIKIGNLCLGPIPNFASRYDVR